MLDANFVQHSYTADRCSPREYDKPHAYERRDVCMELHLLNAECRREKTRFRDCTLHNITSVNALISVYLYVHNYLSVYAAW